jgi:hypothetical protein
MDKCIKNTRCILLFFNLYNPIRKHMVMCKSIRYIFSVTHNLKLLTCFILATKLCQIQCVWRFQKSNYFTGRRTRSFEADDDHYTKRFQLLFFNSCKWCNRRQEISKKFKALRALDNAQDAASTLLSVPTHTHTRTRTADRCLPWSKQQTHRSRFNS